MGANLQQAFSGGVPGQVQGAGQWGSFGTLLGAGGDLLKGVGGSQQYNYMAQMALMNSRIAADNATAAQQAGVQEASMDKLRAGVVAGQQKAAQGANGIDVNFGSAAQVRGSTVRVGDLDAALAQYNANRQTFNDLVQSAGYKAQAGADKKAGFNSLTGGVLNAANTLLGGASSLSNKWAQFQTVGA